MNDMSNRAKIKTVVPGMKNMLMTKFDGSPKKKKTRCLCSA